MPTRSSILSILPGALIAASLTAGASAAQAPVPTVKVPRVSVPFGHPVIVTGRHWPVKASCERRVAVSLSSAQRSFVAGHAKIRTDGSWSFRYVQKDHGVGAYHWRLGALQRCKHGRTRTKGTIPITIHP